MSDERERRRQAVLDALLRITRRDGLDAVSLRTVATEAGTSLGFVQRQFRTKDDILEAAFEHSLAQLGTRIERYVAEVEPGLPAREFLQQVAGEILMTDETYLEEARVWIAFLARAVVSPPLRTELGRHYDAGHELIAIVLRLAQQAGQVPADVDPELEAATLLALVDGLTAHVLIGRLDDEAARRVVATHLDRLCVGGADPGSTSRSASTSRSTPRSTPASRGRSRTRSGTTPS
ncbi:TetR/AcrR family transcriptional regulator [Actinopolymorpha pittospori]